MICGKPAPASFKMPDLEDRGATGLASGICEKLEAPNEDGGAFHGLSFELTLDSEGAPGNFDAFFLRFFSTTLFDYGLDI